MLKSILNNWLIELMGFAIACMVANFLRKHPRVRALVQPDKEIQKLTNEKNEVVKQLERITSEKDRAIAMKEGLLDEIGVLRTVRDRQRATLDIALAEVERMRTPLLRIKDEIHDTEL